MKIYRTIFCLLIFFALTTYSVSEEEKINDKQLEKKANDVLKNFISDAFEFRSPNAIFKLFGGKPTFIDTIEIHNKIDSFKVTKYKGFYIKLIDDSTKIICQLDSIFGNKLIKMKPISVPVEFVKGDFKSKEKVFLKANVYGDWIYFLILSIIVILVLVLLLFRNKYLSYKLSKYWNKYFDIYRVSKKKKTKIKRDVKFKSGESIKAIHENFKKILTAINTGDRNIFEKIEELENTIKERKDYENKLAEREKDIQRLTIKIENEQQKSLELEKNREQLKKDYDDQIKSLNENIQSLTREKTDLEDENEKVKDDYRLLKSHQSEILSNSLQINAIDKKKTGFYNDVCKSILKAINEVPRIIYNQSFQNGNLLNEFNKIILDHYMGNYEQVIKLRDNIDNIIIYQRTNDNLILDKFSGTLSIDYNEFDKKFKELIFDNCIFGKVDKILIGFQNFYSLKYKIKISSDDIDLYAKIYDQIKNIENELTLNLKLCGFEPYPLNLFDEFTVQKSNYVENIGGISLKDKFPLYEKKSEQKYLIGQITQWAYKKNGGLWKNRKASVKISQ